MSEIVGTLVGGEIATGLSEGAAYRSRHGRIPAYNQIPGLHDPRWELAFSVAMVDSMAAQASLLAKQQQDLLAAARQVVAKAGVAA